MSLYSAFVGPFVEYGFMRRALVASIALGLGAGPIGVLLMLRRMSLIGDAMSHAVLPGAAIGFLIAGGLSLPIMGLGGLVAGLSVALLSGLVSRTTVLREDASFASFYLASLALGVLIVSLHGSNIDLLHVLFGTILAIDAASLYLIGAIASLTVAVLAAIYRPLVAECFDPGFVRAVNGRGSIFHALFLFLVVINLVAGFQALGTLMAVGMMMLPAAIAQLWARTLPTMLLIAASAGAVSGLVGLLVSYHLGFASGPTIILTASVIYAVSLLTGPCGARRSSPTRIWRDEPDKEVFMKPVSLVLGLLASAALTLGATVASAKNLDVVVSFTVLADVVKNVGGDHVQVKSLVPPNGDPHEFEPSPNDAKALKAADLVFVSGNGLETWFERLAKASGFKGKPIVVSTGIKTHKMDEDGKTVTDPHVWNSAKNVEIWVRNIEQALTAADPEDAHDFKANAERYAKELGELDAYAHSKIDSVPKEKRKVLTSHDAFGYFARDYGVSFLSPLGVPRLRRRTSPS